MKLHLENLIIISTLMTHSISGGGTLSVSMMQIFYWHLEALQLRELVSYELRVICCWFVVASWSLGATPLKFGWFYQRGLLVVAEKRVASESVICKWLSGVIGCLIMIEILVYLGLFWLVLRLGKAEDLEVSFHLVWAIVKLLWWWRHRLIHRTQGCMMIGQHLPCYRVLAVA